VVFDPRRPDVERPKDKATIGFHAGHLGQIELRVSNKLFRVSVRPRHTAKLARVCEIPSVIRALKRTRIALVPAAKCRAAVGAPVEQRSDDAF